MTTTLFAQPYDLAARGFYFKTAEEFRAKAKTLRNDYCDPVDEFELQFIDGDRIDCELAKATGINQANYAQFFTAVEEWEDWEKVHVIIAVGECGYNFDPEVSPDHLGVELFGSESLRELAEQFVDDGLFGEIPENLQFYIDYDAIARDLSMEYSEITIAGEDYVYACR